MLWRRVRMITSRENQYKGDGERGAFEKSRMPWVGRQPSHGAVLDWATLQ